MKKNGNLFGIDIVAWVHDVSWERRLERLAAVAEHLLEEVRVREWDALVE